MAKEGGETCSLRRSEHALRMESILTSPEKGLAERFQKGTEPFHGPAWMHRSGRVFIPRLLAAALLPVRGCAASIAKV
jgi:hypothetical protein